MRVISVVGGRPNLIKLAAVNDLISEKFDHLILHTGQHYDLLLSQKFFKELKIPKPHKNLEVGSGTHAVQSGKILIGCERYFTKNKPNLVIVYGDMNSTLGAALAAVKLHIPIAHIESGARCFDKNVPEEINRIVTDHVSDLLLAPTINAKNLLAKENLGDKSIFTGDVTYDIFLRVKYKISKAFLRIKKDYAKKVNLKNYQYYFATIHRAENTDNKNRLTRILNEISKLDLPTVLPLHPRTKKMLKTFGLNLREDKVKIIEPTSYLQSLSLQNFSCAILTDSGGVQREAYFLKKPCITLRDSTEWPETISTGANILFFSQKKSLSFLIKGFKIPESHPEFFGNGHAAKKIVNALEEFLKRSK